MTIMAVLPGILRALWSVLFPAQYIQARLVSRFVLCCIVLAAQVFVKPALGEVFMGAKVGKMMVDDNSSTDPINIAANIGYEFDTWLADLSLVGEINRTVDSGKTNQGDKLDFDSNGIFLFWKTAGTIFVTLRGGVAQTETKSGNDSSDSNGLLIGGSIGTVIGQTRLQFEYKSLAGDANFIGIGLEFWLPTN